MGLHLGEVRLDVWLGAGADEGAEEDVEGVGFQPETLDFCPADYGR